MEDHAANGITWYLRIPKANADLLGRIRHWTHLRIASDDGYYWIKDLTPAQVNAQEIKSLPYAEIFYEQDQWLFPRHSSLPWRHKPALLWTPIERALPVTLPSPNLNFFGLEETVAIGLQPSDKEQQAYALMVSLPQLERYLVAAPAIRTRSLQWIIIDEQQALILGHPLLPLDGDTWWLSGNFLLPTGYDLQYPLFRELVENRLVPDNADRLLFYRSGIFIRLPKKNMTPLSLGSFRKSFINSFS